MLTACNAKIQIHALLAYQQHLRFVFLVAPLISQPITTLCTTSQTQVLKLSL